MAGPSDIDKQIGEVRDSMESSIVVLRDRGKRELKRVEKMALIAAGVGATVGVVVIGLVVVRRVSRPPTTRERVERVVPLHWWQRVRSGLAGQVPPMRFYIGERQVGEERNRKQAFWESSAVHVVEALGAAVGTAFATRLASTVIYGFLERAGQAGADPNALRNPDRGRTPP